MFCGEERKHRRRVSVVERFVAHLCWFEANVGPGTVLGTDEPSTEFGYHWFDAHVHDHSWGTSSSVSRALSDTSCDLHHTHQLVAKLVDYVGSPSSLWSCVSRLTLQTRHVEACDERSVHPTVYAVIVIGSAIKSSHTSGSSESSGRNKVWYFTTTCS